MTTSQTAITRQATAPTAEASWKGGRQRWLGRVMQFAVLLAIAGGAVWGYVYWTERPVDEADRQLLAGNPKRALALVDFFLASHPDHSRALALRARSLVQLGNATDAMPIFDRIGAATVEDLRALARAFLLQEQWSRAQPVLLQVLRLQPDDADALHELTSCRIRLGLLDEALESAKKLTAVPHQKARGAIMQAAIYNDLGNHVEAIKYYQRCLDLSPDATDLQLPPDEVFLQFGSVLLNSGHPAEAAEMLQRSIAVRPTPTAQIGLGNAYSQLNQRERALQAWKSGLEIDPMNRAAREALAKAALQDRDFEAARKWLMPIERSPALRSSTAFLFQRVLTLAGDKAEGEKWAERAEKLRQREQTEAILEELLLRSPRSFWSNVVRAHQFAQLGNWGQAQDMLKELVEVEPKEPFVVKLLEAVKTRGELPSLDELPIKKY